MCTLVCLPAEDCTIKLLQSCSEPVCIVLRIKQVAKCVTLLDLSRSIHSSIFCPTEANQMLYEVCFASEAAAQHSC